MATFSVVLAIVGTIVGSGFISGKEIAVFFTRFGLFSYPCIFLAFFLFWGIFYLILIKGDFILDKIKTSKFCFLINFIICTIFSSAMFAGIGNLLKFDNFFVNFLIFIIILIICYLIFKRGAKILNKLNLIFIPLMIIIFILLLSRKFSFSGFDVSSSMGGASIFYCILYIFLNTSNGCVLIAGLGQKLTKKQKARASFLSALVLMLILLFANTLLLQSYSSLSEDMPLLSLLTGGARATMNFVIFIGCSTSLFSLIFASSYSMRGLCNNEFLIFFLSVILPLLLSLFGFNNIVTYLYPLSSVLGLFMMLDFCILYGKKLKQSNF